MKLLLLNQDWFVSELQSFGHEVVTVGTGKHLDVVLNAPLVHYKEVLELLPAGFVPEVLIVWDNSAPIVVDGLDEIDIPSIFYSVDAHHHAQLHSYLGHVFDHTLIAQRDFSGEFEKKGVTPEWMPLWASRELDPSEEKKYGACFVGALNPELNPDRVEFFEALGKLVDIEVLSGDFANYFPFSQIVVNQTVKGDLNFRVFEAMITGAALLTERSGNGLFDLFTDDVHLLTYEKGQVSEAADKIRSGLASPERLHEIGMRGREEILRAHRPIHRAQRIHELIQSLEHRPSPMRRFAWMVNLVYLSSRLSKLDTQLALQCLIFSLRTAEFAIDERCPIDDEISMHLVTACTLHDQQVPGDMGFRLVAKASEVYVENPFFRLSIVRTLLNKGQMQAAKALADEIVPGRPEFVFEKANKLFEELLDNHMEFE